MNNFLFLGVFGLVMGGAMAMPRPLSVDPVTSNSEFPLKLQPELDTEDIGIYIKDEKLVRSQINCVLFDGPCDAVGQWIKPRVQAALLGECAVCTKTQQGWLDTWLEKLIETFPDVHRAAVAKFIQGAGVELAIDELDKINTLLTGNFANSVRELEALDDTGSIGGEAKNSIARAIGRASIDQGQNENKVLAPASSPAPAPAPSTAPAQTEVAEDDSSVKKTKSEKLEKSSPKAPSVVAALKEISNALEQVIQETNGAITTKPMEDMMEEATEKSSDDLNEEESNATEKSPEKARENSTEKIVETEVEVKEEDEPDAATENSENSGKSDIENDETVGATTELPTGSGGSEESEESKVSKEPDSADDDVNTTEETTVNSEDGTTTPSSKSATGTRLARLPF